MEAPGPAAVASSQHACAHAMAYRPPRPFTARDDQRLMDMHRAVGNDWTGIALILGKRRTAALVKQRFKVITGTAVEKRWNDDPPSARGESPAAGMARVPGPASVPARGATRGSARAGDQRDRRRGRPQWNTTFTLASRARGSTGTAAPKYAYSRPRTAGPRGLRHSGGGGGGGGSLRRPGTSGMLMSSSMSSVSSIPSIPSLSSSASSVRASFSSAGSFSRSAPRRGSRRRSRSRASDAADAELAGVEAGAEAAGSAITYATQAGNEQMTAAELDLCKAILERDGVVGNIRRRISGPSDRPHDNMLLRIGDVVEMLMAARELTVRVCELVVEWRRGDAARKRLLERRGWGGAPLLPAPFFWRGDNILLLMGGDLDFVDSAGGGIAEMMPLSVQGNPFLVPAIDPEAVAAAEAESAAGAPAVSYEEAARDRERKRAEGKEEEKVQVKVPPTPLERSAVAAAFAVTAKDSEGAKKYYSFKYEAGQHAEDEDNDEGGDEGEGAAASPPLVMSKDGDLHFHGATSAALAARIVVAALVMLDERQRYPTETIGPEEDEGVYGDDGIGGIGGVVGGGADGAGGGAGDGAMAGTAMEIGVGVSEGQSAALGEGGHGGNHGARVVVSLRPASAAPRLSGGGDLSTVNNDIAIDANGRDGRVEESAGVGDGSGGSGVSDQGGQERLGGARSIGNHPARDVSAGITLPHLSRPLSAQAAVQQQQQQKPREQKRRELAPVRSRRGRAKLDERIRSGAMRNEWLETEIHRLDRILLDEQEDLRKTKLIGEHLRTIRRTADVEPRESSETTSEQGSDPEWGEGGGVME